MKTIDVSDRVIYGDLAARASLLAGRLEKKEYRPETILNMDQSGWPGDWEGRTILALVRLAETTKKEPAWLDEIVTAVLNGRNERGYLGHILPDGEADEQQLSGHGWLLRGLVAYAAYRKRDDVLDAAKTIVENLFLPLYETYKSYPIRPEERVYGGAEAGNVAKVVGKWHISTDTGCAYIPLDGLTALYEVTRDERLLALLRVMIENFLKIDFAGICAQTHATLTACRGILRLYGVTGDEELLSAVRSLFSLYTTTGMTANYANYNWFGRPEWTEPCAIIDSFMVAMQLFRYTGEADYVTLAQRIYYNGIGFGQRENGGFGCDTCLGAAVKDSHILRVSCPEAYWCCTMRGGEGLSAVAEYAVLVQENTVILPYLTPLTADIATEDGTFRLSVSTGYPYAGNAKLSVSENTAAGALLCVYLPDGTTGVTVSGARCRRAGTWLLLTLTGEEQEISLSFTLPLDAEVPANAGDGETRRALFCGNLMLSAKAENGERALSVTALSTAPVERGTVVCDGITLHPLFDAYETDHEPRQVLFCIE